MTATKLLVAAFALAGASSDPKEPARMNTTSRS